MVPLLTYTFLVIPTSQDIWDSFRDQLWPSSTGSGMNAQSELINFMLHTPSRDADYMQAILDASSIFEYLAFFALTMVIAYVIFAVGANLMPRSKALTTTFKIIIVGAILQNNPDLLFYFYDIFDKLTVAFLKMNTVYGTPDSAGEFATGLVIKGAEIFAGYGLFMMTLGFLITVLTYLFLLLMLTFRFFTLIVAPLVFPIVVVAWPLQDILGGQLAKKPMSFLAHIFSSLFLAPTIAIVMLVTTIIVNGGDGALGQSTISTLLESVILAIGLYTAFKFSSAGKQLMGKVGGMAKTAGMVAAAGALGGAPLAAQTGMASVGGIGGYAVGGEIGNKLEGDTAQDQPDDLEEDINGRAADGQDTPQATRINQGPQGPDPTEEGPTPDGAGPPQEPEVTPEQASEIDYKYADQSGPISDTDIEPELDETYRGRYMTDETIREEGYQPTDVAMEGRDSIEADPDRAFGGLGGDEEQINRGQVQAEERGALERGAIDRGEAEALEAGEVQFNESLTDGEKQIGTLEAEDGTQITYDTSVGEKQLNDGETYTIENGIASEGRLTADQHTTVKEKPSLTQRGEMLVGNLDESDLISEGKPDTIGHQPKRRHSSKMSPELSMNEFSQKGNAYVGDDISITDKGKIDLIDPDSSSRIDALPENTETIGEFTGPDGKSSMVAFDSEDIAQEAASDRLVTFESATVDTMSAHSDRSIEEAYTDDSTDQIVSNQHPILSVSDADSIQTSPIMGDPPIPEDTIDGPSTENTTPPQTTQSPNKPSIEQERNNAWDAFQDTESTASPEDMIEQHKEQRTDNAIDRMQENEGVDDLFRPD